MRKKHVSPSFKDVASTSRPGAPALEAAAAASGNTCRRKAGHVSRYSKKHLLAAAVCISICFPLASPGGSWAEEFDLGIVRHSRDNIPLDVDRWMRWCKDYLRHTLCSARARSFCDGLIDQTYLSSRTVGATAEAELDFILVPVPPSNTLVPIPVWDITCSARCKAECQNDLPHDPADCEFTNELVCGNFCTGTCVRLSASCYACSQSGGGGGTGGGGGGCNCDPDGNGSVSASECENCCSGTISGSECLVQDMPMPLNTIR